MSQVSAVLRKTTNGYAHWCPACSEMHVIQTQSPQPNGAQWSFDGNVNKPTFGPSVRIRIGTEGQPGHECCHYNLVAGELRYCGDCTHALRDTNVPLPPLPAELRDA